MHKTMRICWLPLGLLLVGVPMLPAQDPPGALGRPVPLNAPPPSLPPLPPDPAPAPAGPAMWMNEPGNGCPVPAGGAGYRKGNIRSCLQNNLLGYPSQFYAPPLGATIGQHFLTQVRNADPHRLMLYDFDFVCGTEKLNCHGQVRLARMARMLAEGAPAVLVQARPCCPGLNEARRVSVHHTLLANGVPAALARVAIGSSPNLPLSGAEAVLVYGNLLRQTQSVGTVPGTSAIAGGFSPGGFTGGGVVGSFGGLSGGAGISGAGGLTGLGGLR